ncbi:hypothetical protein CLIM01_08299 [Colletotrichum limetticola]|uniref:Uncharacterized protein n=1 Tax=Colletotrichum limetticola TaxID=1209924 RepID=A0ABQ9PS78_9PEZI|nr:hypothetical protein CLIM01_08299 [Colletotrichum limetticola]
MVLQVNRCAFALEFPNFFEFDIFVPIRGVERNSIRVFGSKSTLSVRENFCCGPPIQALSSFSHGPHLQAGYMHIIPD